MERQRFDMGDRVKLGKHTENKYKFKPGTPGRVNDVFQSPHYEGYVYEVDFGQTLLLIYEHDLMRKWGKNEQAS